MVMVVHRDGVELGPEEGEGGVRRGSEGCGESSVRIEGFEMR